VTIADQINAILLAKADAIVRRAADRLDGLIRPDFVYVNASGRTFDKAGYIETYCTSGKIAFEKQRFSNLSVQASPGRAEATLIAHDRFVVDGETIAATYQSLCVFVEGPGGWQWIAGRTRTAG
jgi:hypothetical protein